MNKSEKIKIISFILIASLFLLMVNDVRSQDTWVKMDRIEYQQYQEFKRSQEIGINYINPTIGSELSLVDEFMLQENSVSISEVGTRNILTDFVKFFQTKLAQDIISAIFGTNRKYCSLMEAIAISTLKNLAIELPEDY